MPLLALGNVGQTVSARCVLARCFGSCLYGVPDAPGPEMVDLPNTIVPGRVRVSFGAAQRTAPDLGSCIGLAAGQDVAIDDEPRSELRNTLQALLEETFNSGVEVTLVYAADQDFLLLDTRESAMRAECRTTSERVETLVVSLYGDDAYLFQVRAPAVDLGDAECSFVSESARSSIETDRLWPNRVHTCQSSRALQSRGAPSDPIVNASEAGKSRSRAASRAAQSVSASIDGSR